MTQIKEKKYKKKGRLFSKTFFPSVLTKKQREKPESVSVNLSGNIPTITETIPEKSSMYLPGMSSHIENFTIPMNEIPN